MEEITHKFKAYLESRNKEESTIRMYVHEVKQFLSWLDGRKKDLKELNSEDVTQFRNFLIEKNMKVSTINKTLSTLSSFLKWAKENDYSQLTLPVHIRLNEDRKSVQARWLTEQEELELLELASKDKNKFKKARNEALILVMLDAGLRVEEVSNLHIKHLGEDTITIFHDDELSRQVPLVARLEEKLSDWLSIRNMINKQVYNDSPFLFVTERSGKMQPRAIQFVIEGYSAKLGSAVTSQLLRNTYCRRLVEQGATVEQVKKQAGHKSIVTSYKYF